ncbi:hypothetical protein L484_007194 [Morus notabilis]|uniref:Uncharacterized protein n=1 Tax=Morus notabilis TaxID=981085 RepID=W9R0B3_9ROSA|nr:uncharacterized protein LOC21390600 [Morus notabilis]EXB53251.1 hypothetical protein L484_007194 [Morus notabilis]
MASGGITTRSLCAHANIPAPLIHANLYKWLRLLDGDLSSLAGSKANNIIVNTCGGTRAREQPKVVDSVSCRQMFLRSYTFSRKESFPEKTKKRFGKIVRVGGLFRRITAAKDHKYKRQSAAKRKRSCLVVVRRVKEASSAALSSMCRRFLFCTAKVDVLARRSY